MLNPPGLSGEPITIKNVNVLYFFYLFFSLHMHPKKRFLFEERIQVRLLFQCVEFEKREDRPNTIFLMFGKVE